MTSQPRPRLTPEQYLAADRAAAQKSEFLSGEVFAMSGASERHNVLVANVIAELRTQLKGRPCRVYPSDMRVRVPATGLYAYPDVTIACGKPEFDDENQDVLLNPTVIIEVLSKSTEAYDRGEKFAHYRRLPSLKEYVLIAQDRLSVECYTRQSKGEWLLSESRAIGESVSLPAAGCVLQLAEVYDKVDLSAA
jgi:Uma2 family endonuclease